MGVIDHLPADAKGKSVFASQGRHLEMEKFSHQKMITTFRHGSSNLNAELEKMLKRYPVKPRKGDDRPSREMALELHNEALLEFLPATFCNLAILARGGFQEVERTFAPAGTMTVTRTVEGPDGPEKVTEPMFPDVDPSEMVCVKEVHTIAKPDRLANVVLMERIAGRPQFVVEHTGPNGSKLPPMIEATINQIYGQFKIGQADPPGIEANGEEIDP